MRIALYLNNLWGISATTRIAYMLAKRFSEKGHDVLFIINKHPVEISKEFPVKILKSKGEILRAYELARFSKDKKIDVVLSFMRPQSNVSGLINRFFRKSRTIFIGSVHNNDNYLSYSKLYHLPYRFLEKWLLEANDKIVAVSNAVKEDLKKAFFINQKKIEVIYNPIDLELINKMAKESIEPELETLFEKHPVLINVARMEPQKGLNHLINIFEKVNQILPETKLVLIGDGTLRRALEKKVFEKGLNKKVLFLGWRKNPFPYMARAKLFVLTSLWEGFGMVLIEAMALGIPVIAFATRGGHVEILQNCCPLISYPNEDEYAHQIVEILKSENFYKKLQRNVKAKVKQFDSRLVADKYLELFLHISKSKFQ